MRNEQPFLPIEPGQRASVTAVVQRVHLASAYAVSQDEAYPDVFSTPALLGLLERACAAQLTPLLRAGEMSVGVRVSMTHLAPTPLGSSVTATAEFLRQDGKLYVFRVTADDETGSIANGEHTRAIVKAEKVQQTAQARKK